MLRRWHDVLVVGGVLAFFVSLYFNLFWLSPIIFVLVVILARSPEESEALSKLKSGLEERRSRK